MPVRQDGDFVLYWMTASRRTTWNLVLDRAVEWVEKLRKPLVIYEVPGDPNDLLSARFAIWAPKTRLASSMSLTTSEDTVLPY